VGGSWRQPVRVVLVQVVLVEPARRVAGQAEVDQGGGDPVVLGLGEGDGVGRAAGHDGPLEGGVAAAQVRVGAQGVSEAAHGGDLRTAGWDHVHMDRVLRHAIPEGAPQHRSAGRERRRDLRLEPELAQAWVMAGM
jgi:hypothetical protein